MRLVYGSLAFSRAEDAAGLAALRRTCNTTATPMWSLSHRRVHLTVTVSVTSGPTATDTADVTVNVNWQSNG